MSLYQSHIYFMWSFSFPKLIKTNSIPSYCRIQRPKVFQKTTGYKNSYVSFFKNVIISLLRANSLMWATGPLVLWLLVFRVNKTWLGQMIHMKLQSLFLLKKDNPNSRFCSYDHSCHRLKYSQAYLYRHSIQRQNSVEWQCEYYETFAQEVTVNEKLWKNIALKLQATYVLDIC